LCRFCSDVEDIELQVLATKEAAAGTPPADCGSESSVLEHSLLPPPPTPAAAAAAATTGDVCVQVHADAADAGAAADAAAAATDATGGRTDAAAAADGTTPTEAEATPLPPAPATADVGAVNAAPPTTPETSRDASAGPRSDSKRDTQVRLNRRCFSFDLTTRVYSGVQ